MVAGIVGVYFSDIASVNSSENLVNSNNDSSENIINDNTSTNDIDNDELKIVIDYNGKYTAGYGSAYSNNDVTTAGYQEYNLGKTSYVDVGAKKSDSSSNLLKITIYKGNKIVKEGSTSAPYGEVVLHYQE